MNNSSYTINNPVRYNKTLTAMLVSAEKYAKDLLDSKEMVRQLNMVQDSMQREIESIMEEVGIGPQEGERWAL